jgi:hypothetical protein
MIGAVLIVVAMLIGLPTLLFLGGAVWAALLGQVLTLDGEERYADTPT